MAAAQDLAVQLITATALMASVMTVTSAVGRDRCVLAVAETLRGFRHRPGRVTVDGQVAHEVGTSVVGAADGIPVHAETERLCRARRGEPWLFGRQASA